MSHILNSTSHVVSYMPKGTSDITDGIVHTFSNIFHSVTDITVGIVYILCNVFHSMAYVTGGSFNCFCSLLCSLYNGSAHVFSELDDLLNILLDELGKPLEQLAESFLDRLPQLAEDGLMNLTMSKSGFQLKLMSMSSLTTFPSILHVRGGPPTLELAEPPENEIFVMLMMSPTASRIHLTFIVPRSITLSHTGLTLCDELADNSISRYLPCCTIQ